MLKTWKGLEKHQITTFTMLRSLFFLAILTLATAFHLSPTFRPSISLNAQVKLTNSAGKAVIVAEGSPLKAACSKLGIKPKYSCKK